MVTVLISALALVVSIGALAVSFLEHRVSGPRISVTDYLFTKRAAEYWLEIRVTNSGRSDVTIEGGYAEWLGSCITDLPARLAAGSSEKLVFRGELPPAQYSGGSFAAIVGLGNGQTVVKRIKLSEQQLGDLDITSSYAPQSAVFPEASAQVPLSLVNSPVIQGTPSPPTLLVLKRDGDAEEESKLLKGNLVKSLPSWIVTSDIKTEEPGANIVKHAQKIVRDSEAVLLVMGPSWLNLLKHRGQTAVAENEDLYDAVLRAALASDTHIIPILIADAKRIHSSDLPADMREIALRIPIDLTRRDYQEQMEKLVKYLEQRRDSQGPDGFRMAIDIV